jgi:hypothetical protein
MSNRVLFVLIALALPAPAASAGDARHLHKSDCVNPQMFTQMTGGMGVVLDGPGQVLPVGKSTTAVVRPTVGDRTTAMSRAGFKPGDKVKISHTKAGSLVVERTGGTPLSFVVNVQDIFRPEQILDWGGHIGIKFDGKMALLGKGYIKKDRVTVTNLVDRSGEGSPHRGVLPLSAEMAAPTSFAAEWRPAIITRWKSNKTGLNEAVGGNMRFVAVLAITLSITISLGGCGGDDSGEFSEDMLDPGPSSRVPALVDPAGMTEAQLEAELERVEGLHDELMEEMQKLSPRARDGAMDPETAREMMQINADMKALREQMNAYDEAIDALYR